MHAAAAGTLRLWLALLAVLAGPDDSDEAKTKTEVVRKTWSFYHSTAAVYELYLPERRAVQHPDNCICGGSHCG